MKNKSLIIAVVLLFLTVSGPSMGSAAWAEEIYFVVADEIGNNNYMALNDDGTLSDPMLIANTGWIPYGNGIGDFDNDGDLDYIVANGVMAGAVHLFEKLDTGNQFAAPVEIASWSGAYFPGKMVIADFNEDGNLDFVLTYYYGSGYIIDEDAHLFLGDGSLGFDQPIVIPDSTPSDAIAADTADFDNDGHADFVSAPSSYTTQLYVNFGDGTGNFVTEKIDVHNAGYYLGIAAADFNGDGTVDLAATTLDGIDFYWGDGQRGFAIGTPLVDQKILDSPMDSYDIDSDGDQDLIIGSYDDSDTNTGDVIAVFKGDGSGNFATSPEDQYGAGDGIWRIAIAAPAPPVTEDNEEPIAVIEPSELNVAVGEPAEYSAVESFDSDGEIVSYSWDFGNGDVVETFTATQKDFTATHVFYEAGDHTITLTVTDDQGATNSITAVAHVSAAAAKVFFAPRILNLKSKGKWVKAYIKLPRGYNAQQIDLGSLVIVDPETGQKIVAASKGRCKRWWKRLYVAKFDRQALIDYIEEPAKRVELQIKGKVLQNDGLVDFAATGKIRAIKPEPRRKYWRNYWKR